MQTLNPVNEFIKELDTRALSKGCKRLAGSAYGSMIWQGYAYRAKMLQYVGNGGHLVLQVLLQGPESSLIAAIQDAINPTFSQEQHEGRLREDIQFDWNEEKGVWKLLSGNPNIPCASELTRGRKILIGVVS